VRLIALPRSNHKALSAWRRFVESDDIFGLDVESDVGEGLGTYSDTVKMRLIQFGNRHEAWAFDPRVTVWRFRVVELLSRQDKRFVSHNAAFDTTRVLHEFGITLGDRSIDTLPMAALCWPGKTKRKGLKALCDEFIDNQLSDADKLRGARFTDLFYANKPRKSPMLPKSFVPGVSVCRRPKGRDEKCTEPSWEGSLCGYCYDHWLHRKGTAESEAWGWKNIALDDPYYSRYAGLDAVYVRRLLDILGAEVKRRQMGTLSKTEQRVKRQMSALSVRGMRVDAEWTEPILLEIREEFNAAEAKVEELTGGVKARSYVKMREWFAEHGARGVTSLDKDHLPGLIEKYGDDDAMGPVLEQLSEVSRNANLLTNLEIIWRHATEGDGFVHPNINTMQAHTGRMSATDPAVQTLAKKGLKGERLRGCFIARDGHVLIGADYDSQEIRIGAALSRDEALMRIVMEGLNQHVLTAESIWPEFEDKATNPDLYAHAKTLDFAQQYGAMPKKIAATLKIPEREAFKMWQGWRRTYRGLVEWSDRQARKDEVRNPFGRLIPRDPYRDYANANYMIQSTGRDILGAALCRLEDEGWAPYFWLPIHDELVMEVPEDLAEKGCDALTRLMSTELLGVPIPAEGEVVGIRWRGLG
jgi:DNA polymerase-1